MAETLLANLLRPIHHDIDTFPTHNRANRFQHAPCHLIKQFLIDTTLEAPEIVITQLQVLKLGRTAPELQILQQRREDRQHSAAIRGARRRLRLHIVLENDPMERALSCLPVLVFVLYCTMSRPVIFLMCVENTAQRRRISLRQRREIAAMFR